LNSDFLAFGHDSGLTLGELEESEDFFGIYEPTYQLEKLSFHLDIREKARKRGVFIPFNLNI
jgi:hypothetical protein